jgi:26S proteasome regulatory subunit N10
MMKALQMSMQATATPATQPKPKDDISSVMEDPNFVNSVLMTLPGVDPNDERIKVILALG